MNTDITSVVVLVTYLSVLIGIGIYQGRKVKTGADFAIAGRDLPGWVAALSERATDCSAWMLLGVPGSAYALGISSAWACIGCLIGSAGAWWLVAERLRKDADRVDALTYINWVSKRHKDNEKGIRLFGSFTIAFFFIIYVGAQFIGGGKTFFTLFGINPTIGILVTACIVAPYTLYGGFGSVVYTDCLQSVIMFAALVLGPIFGIIYLANNPTEVYATSVLAAMVKAGPKYVDWFAGATDLGKGVVVGNGLAWCVAYLGGLPQLNTRFMAIKDEKNAKTGRVIAVTYIVLGYFGAVFMGFVGIAIFGPDTLRDAELVMPSVMMKVFPSALATLMITGGIAAMLSTADSLLALVSAEVSEDIIKPYFLKRDLTREEGLRVSRIVTLTITGIALGVAYLIPQKLIFQIVSYVWAGLGNPFTVVTLLTLYWDKFTGKAALWTIIVGLFFTIFWIASGLDAKVISSMLAGFIASLITAVTVTYLTQEKK